MRLIEAAAALLAVVPAWGAADPQLLGLLMPEAKLIAGVQLGQAKASPFGQFVLSQAGANAEFDKIKAATGFDPRTDLTEIAGAATVTSGAGLVAGRGSFEPARLANFAMTAGAKVESYRGFNLIHSGGQEAVAFLDARTVVLGSTEHVKSAVDRWLSGQSSNALASRAATISATSQAWAVATGLSELQGGPAANAPPEAQMMQNVLSKISQLSGGLNFADTITMHGQAITSSGQDAQALADVLQFLLTMASSKAPLPVTPQVSASGTAVNFVATLTQQQAEQIFKPAQRR